MVYEFNCVFGEFENTIVIEHSKFICNILHIENENEAKEFIENIKKKHSLANHHCYAYIADENGLNMKFSDDGEPQGTAGMPMLEVLKNKKIYKTVAVVTRYFGGVLLGTGGLTRAYSSSVSECLNISNVKKQVYSKNIKITCNYENYQKLLKLLQNPNISVLKTDFLNDIEIQVAIKNQSTDFYDSFINSIKDLFRGNEKISYISDGYFTFDDK